MGRNAGAIALFAALVWANAAPAAEKLSVLFAPTTGLMPSYTAKDEGIFERHGLDVDLALLTNQGAVISALIAGTAQIGTPSALAVIQANDAGLDMVFVASSNVSPSASRNGIFVKNGSNLHTPADLIGKRVGVPSINTLIHVLVRRWLKENGVDYNKVNFAEVGFQQMADGLNAGIVDAVDAIDPYYDRVGQVGYAIGNAEATMPKGSLTSVYAATREWADGHKAEIKAFRESLAEAIAFIARDEGKARKSLGKYTRLPDAVVAITPLPNLEVTMRPEQVKFFIDLAREQGLIKSNPDAAHMIAP
jgi:NitT/TauT family transport system substrate-binding protein